ncbi:MAG: hypothetical protein KBS52_04040 [Clostridiales bacterium]|nr:hypothetical protein [Candidatus Equinaster intestinalis]
MKKILSCVFVFLLLCGCKAEKVEPVVGNIEFSAKFECDEQEFVCSCKSGEKGNFTAKFLEPQTVKGLEYVYTADDFSVKFEGLTYKPESKKSAFSGILNEMYAAFCDAAGKQADTEEKEFLLKGNNYKIFFSETGLPIKALIGKTEIIIFDVKRG